MSIINLGDNFIPEILEYIKDLFVDISPLIFILIGLALAFWIIEFIIDLIIKKREE